MGVVFKKLVDTVEMFCYIIWYYFESKPSNIVYFKGKWLETHQKVIVKYTYI